MKTSKKIRRNGLIIQADDLEIGRYYTVHGLRNGSDNPVPVVGMAFKVTAMNLPFVVGIIAAEPSQPSVTFDVRYLNFMKVTDEFVQAQRPQPAQDLFRTKTP